MERDRTEINDAINSRVLAEYDLSVDKARPVRGGYQVDTYEGRRLIKRSRALPDAIFLASQALDHLISRGFHNVVPIRPTKYGDPWVKEAGQLYYQTDWISGKEFSIKRSEQLLEAIMLLARMQSAAVGFAPSSPAAGREKWHTWTERYQERLDDLKGCSEIVEKNGICSEFDSLFITEVEGFIEQGRLSVELLNQADYRGLVEEARREGGICHRDFVGRNLIRSRRREIYIVNFDNCQLDLKVFDLGRLLSWALPNFGWDFDLAEGTLSRYQEVIPLKKDEILLLASYLNFPQRLWFLARKNYLEPSGGRNELEGLQEFLVEQPVRQEFIRQFLKHYLISD